MEKVLGKFAPSYKGDYVPGTYQMFDVVFDGESSFISLKDNNSVALANDGVNWIYLCKGSYLATQAIEDGIDSVLPVIPYAERVEDISGATISSKEDTKFIFDEMQDLLPYTELLVCPQAGLKVESGKVSALYDFKNAKDATQATDANRPYIAGNIAPNEKRAIKNMNTSTEVSLNHTAITKANTDSWSVITTLKYSGKRSVNASGVYAGANTGNYTAFYVDRNNVGYIAIYDSSTNEFGSDNHLMNNYIGKTTTIIWTYSNGSIKLFINGILIKSGTKLINLNLNMLANGFATRQFAGEIYYHQILNKELSASEVQNISTILAAQYPEIEGVNIGNQHWQTSNYEGVITANGTVIPEVTDNAEWAALTTPAWCYYNNDAALGAVYGKLYNHYAVDAIAANPPSGWRVPTKADFDQLISYLGGTDIAGGKAKLQGTTYWNTSNIGATNEVGLSLIGSGLRGNSGSFSFNKSFGFEQTLDESYTASFGYVTTYNSTEFLFSEVKVNAGIKTGMPIRLIRTSPVGTDTQKLSTGVFTTDITSTYKLLNIPFGYQVTAIKVKCDSNVTNFKCDMYDYAGSVLQATLVTGKTATANVPIKFGVSADSPIQYQDAQLRFTCSKAVSTANLEIGVVIEKIL